MSNHYQNDVIFSDKPIAFLYEPQHSKYSHNNPHKRVFVPNLRSRKFRNSTVKTSKIHKDTEELKHTYIE